MPLVGMEKPRPVTRGGVFLLREGFTGRSCVCGILHRRLSGVVLEVIPGLNDSDELNVWTLLGGAQIAWFKDPDGNVLSVTKQLTG